MKLKLGFSFIFCLSVACQINADTFETVCDFIGNGKLKEAQSALDINAEDKLSIYDCYRVIKVICRAGDTDLHTGLIQHIFKYANSVAIKSVKQERKYPGVAAISDLRKLDSFPVDMVYACFMGNINCLKLMLESGGYAVLDQCGWDMLYSAVLMKRKKIVQFLLDKQVSLKGKDKLDGHSIWHLAVSIRDSCVKKKGENTAIEVLQELERVYSERNGKEKFDYKVLSDLKQIPAHLVCRFDCHYIRAEMLQYLIIQGADIEAKDIYGRRPLHCAALWGCDHMIKVLLSNNAEVNATDKNGDTALHIACESGQLDVIFALLKSSKLNVSLKNNNGDTPLHIILRKDLGKTSGVFCDVITLLLNKQAAVDSKNNSCVAVLHLFASNAYFFGCNKGCSGYGYFKYIADNYQKVNWDVRDNNRSTLLHYFIKREPKTEKESNFILKLIGFIGPQQKLLLKSEDKEKQTSLSLCMVKVDAYQDSLLVYQNNKSMAEKVYATKFVKNHYEMVALELERIARDQQPLALIIMNKLSGFRKSLRKSLKFN